MDLRQTIAHLAQDKTEQLLLVHIAEQSAAAARRNIPVSTGFLSAREQMLVRQLPMQAVPTFFGGCDGAERQICCFLPDYLDAAWLTDEDSPVAALRATWFAAETLTHRDLLGALMGAGVARDTVGDLHVSPGQCDMIVLRQMQDYILQTLTSAGRTKLHLTPLPLRELTPPQAAVKTRHDTVSSLRLDSVLASAFSVSRGKAADYITAGRVELNHALCQKPDRPVTSGDVFSVRGLGRARLDSVDGTTKKGRTGITVSRFV